MFIKIGASSLLRGVHKVGACVRGDWARAAGGAAPTRGADARRRGGRDDRDDRDDSSRCVPSQGQ